MYKQATFTFPRGSRQHSDTTGRPGTPTFNNNGTPTNDTTQPSGHKLRPPRLDLTINT